METFDKVLEYFKITDLPRHSPIEIPNVSRTDLAKLFNFLGFKAGVEVGTEQGLYAEVLCKENPNLHLYCVDLWQIYPFYRDYGTEQLKLNNYHARWVERMKPYNATPIQKYSMEAVKDFPDGSLDFIYIDANHELPFVTEDIFYWSRKVKTGGIISGHDWYETIQVSSRCHVVGAVLGYTRAFKIKQWFLLGTKGMYPGQVRDRSRSWFWVKDERQP